MLPSPLRAGIIQKSSLNLPPMRYPSSGGSPDASSKGTQHNLSTSGSHARARLPKTSRTGCREFVLTRPTSEAQPRPGSRSICHPGQPTSPAWNLRTRSKLVPIMRSESRIASIIPAHRRIGLFVHLNRESPFVRSPAAIDPNDLIDPGENGLRGNREQPDPGGAWASLARR